MRLINSSVRGTAPDCMLRQGSLASKTKAFVKRASRKQMRARERAFFRREEQDLSQVRHDLHMEILAHEPQSFFQETHARQQCRSNVVSLNDYASRKSLTRVVGVSKQESLQVYASCAA